MIVEYRPSVEGLKNIFMGYERRILDRLDNWWWYSTCNISGYTKL